MLRPVFKQALSIAAMVLLLSAPRAFSQNTTGEIDGTVTDSTGAAISNATVTFVRPDTKETVRTVKTNSKGSYSAPLLMVGTYTITAAAEGFQSTKVIQIDLNVGDTRTVDAILKPGDVDITITVTSSKVQPDLETATQGTLINETEMKELALNTRNFEEMVLLQPGVSYTGDDQNYAGQVDASGNVNLARISINGLRNTQLSWSLDSADILNEENSAQVTLFPSVDSIAQIKTLRSSYGAQYGGGGSAQIIAVTKAGTSQFHGDAYYFFRNQYLNANNFFNLLAVPIVPRPPIRYNAFGYTLSGPLFIPRIYPRDRSHTFFFFSQEMRRIALFPTNVVNTEPTLEEMQGYMEWNVDTNGVPTPGKCPIDTANTGTSPYANFPCQLTTSIDPAAQAYINDVMRPTVLAHPQNNPQVSIHSLIEEDKSTNSQTQESVRFDHQFNQRLSAFVRYIYDPSLRNVPAGYGRANNYPGVGNSTIYDYGEDLLADTTFTANASTVVEFGYSYLPYTIEARVLGLANLSRSPDVKAAFTLPFTNTTGRIPTITINQGVAWGTNGPKDSRNHTQQAFLNVTHQLGSHTFYVGGNYEHFYSRINSGTANAGSFGFAGNYPNTFSEFLAGQASSFTQSSIDPISRITENIYALYMQDNWRLLPHLSLNLGVRYSYYGQPYDGANHLGGLLPWNYDKTKAPTIAAGPSGDGSMCIANVVNPACAGFTPNPAFNQFNGIINAGVNSPFGRALSRQAYLNFAPRVGFAWDVYGDGKTSLRGGFGIFYNHSPLTLAEGAVDGNPEYVQNISATNSAGIVSLDSPSVPAQTAVLNIAGQDPNWKTPYTESYSLDVQQSLAQNLLLDVSFVGNRTIHLQGEEDLNQPLPGAYALLGLDPNAKQPGFSNAPASAAQDAKWLNAILPYQGWGAIDFYGTRYFADYNGLQTQITKRFSDRSLIAVSYTWSKALANSSGESGSSAANRYDLRAEWGPTDTDRRHMLVAHAIYDLPFLRKRHDLVGQAFGGWEVSAIVQMRTGVPLSAGGTNLDPAGQDILNPGDDAPQRPDQIGDPNEGGLRNATVNRFFNTAAFLQNLPLGTYRPGNAPVGSITGPNYANVTFDLFKNFHPTERLRLQIRAEAFNLFNHVNINSVGANINNSANFGTALSAYDNRQLQFGARLSF